MASSDLGAGSWVEQADQVGARDRRDDPLDVLGALAAVVGIGDRGHPVAVAVDGPDLSLGQHLAAEALDLGPVAVGDLADAPALRVPEALDLLRGRFALVAVQERAPGCVEEVRHRDPLRGPVGGDLARAHAPRLLGVGAEEDPVDGVSESLARPVLEVVVRDGPDPVADADREVVEKRPDQHPRRQVAHDVARLERIVEVALVEKDPREPLERREVARHQRLEMGDELRVLRMPAVRPAVVDHVLPCERAGAAADDGLRLEDDHARAGGREPPRTGEPGQARAEDVSRRPPAFLCHLAAAKIAARKLAGCGAKGRWPRSRRPKAEAELRRR